MSSIDKFQNIGEMIDAGTAKENTWYWVDRRKVRINDEIYYPSQPLKAGRDAIVIPTNLYFSTYLRVAKHPCVAVMLKKIATSEGEKMMMYRQVSVAHWARAITPEKPIIDSINWEYLQKGVHYFRADSEGKLTALKAEDIPFLRCYYRVRVTEQPDTIRTVTYEKVRPLVMRYVIYEYYPSGFMKKRVEVTESRIMGPPRDGDIARIDRYAENRDKQIEYTVYDRPFNDKGVKQTTPSDQTITVLTDRNSPLWIQNILHD
jgi:hypothetical protein